MDGFARQSGGRLEMNLFPANQLGSDTDLISQVRNGGVEFLNIATSILNTLVPAVGSERSAMVKWLAQNHTRRSR